MKKIIFSIALVLGFTVINAQVPDSSRSRIKTPAGFRTDSVKNGNDMYNGSKSRNSKSNGDTLSAPKNNSKSGSMKPKNKTTESK